MDSLTRERHHLGIGAKLLIACAAVLLPLAVGNLVRKGLEAPPSDGIRWRATEDGLRVGWAPPALQVAAGDRLLLVDQVPVSDHLGLALLLEARRPGDHLAYVFDREGQALERQVSVRRAPEAALHIYLFLVGLASLVIGLVSLRKAASRHEALVLAATTLAFFAMLGFSPSGLMDLADKVYFAVDELGRLALAPLLVHLALVLPPAARGLRRRWLYLPSAVLALADVAYHLGGASMSPATALASGRFLDRAGLVLLGLGSLAALAVAARKWRSARIDGAPGGVLLTGLALGLGPVVALYLLPRALGLAAVEEVGRVSVLALVALPASWAYVTLGLGPGDLRVIARRSLGWATALAGVGGVYLGAQELAGLALGGHAGASSEALVGLASVVLALLSFVPVKRYSDAMVALVFSRGAQRDQELIRRFGRSLSEEIRLPELVDQLLERVSTVVDTPRLAVYLRADEPGSYRLLRLRGDYAEQPPQSLHFLPPELLASAEGGVVSLNGVGRRLGLGDGDGLTHVFPLVGRGQLSGLLALTAAPRGLSFEDVELLRDLAGYAAAAFENALLYSEVTQKMDEIRALETFRHDVIESLSVGVLITDLEGVILAANPAIERLLEQPDGALRGHMLADVLPAPLARHAAAGTRAAQEPALFKVRQSGREAIVSVATTPLRRGADAYGLIVTVEDVTERIDAQSHSLQQDKLASLGLLAAGVAHEVNTPLAGIASYTQLVLDGLEPSDPHRETLKKVETQCFRAARIVQNLLNFARKSERDAVGQVHLGGLVGETLALVDYEIRKAGIRLHFEPGDDASPLMAEEGALQQVVINLVKNAIDAMPKGGELRVATRQEEDATVLEVADDGQGIAPEDRERIFDPFFTTKERGRGVGLGLSVAYGLVREHGGTIRVESAPGRGSCFTVRLPRRTVPARSERAGERLEQRAS